MAEYIDREAAISLIKQYGLDAIDGGRYSLDTVDDCIELANRIEALPTEDVAPVVHGRWEVSTDEWYETDVYTCSKCREDYVLVEGTPKENLWHYCPNCGAQMHEDDFCSYSERKEDKDEK